MHDPTGNSRAAHGSTVATQIGQEMSLTLGILVPYAAEIVRHGRRHRSGFAHAAEGWLASRDIAFLQV